MKAAPKPRPQTEAEAKARKRALEYLIEDAKRVCTTNISQPFSSLQDAIDRLLPFHVLGSLDPTEADVEELAASSDVGHLLASRREAAQEAAVQAAVEACNTLDAIQQRLAKFHDWYDQRRTKLLPEEELTVEHQLKDLAQRALDAERMRSQVGAMTSSDESDDDDDDDSDEDDEDEESGDGQAASKGKGKPPTQADSEQGTNEHVRLP